jgi:hypothetical protein
VNGIKGTRGTSKPALGIGELKAKAEMELDAGGDWRERGGENGGGDAQMKGKGGGKRWPAARNALRGERPFPLLLDSKKRTFVLVRAYWPTSCQ